MGNTNRFLGDTGSQFTVILKAQENHLLQGTKTVAKGSSLSSLDDAN